ncbi:hypothetical protein [Psychrobacter sp. ANT_H3]|uniref:hypothetical protein n=1 Tax=Psychrobacter sp. ANT_H3 TaxID=3019444 RepID=UPI0022F190B4|nr:hypothetical protein [Psychrobacter sp. ANT_H3]MDA5132080.1 hypothetical protein [Psychrobacter sp. ANT_H3]
MSLFTKLSDTESKMIEKCWIIVFSLLMVFYSYEALAAVTCDAGFETDSFLADDYNKLAPSASPPSLKIDQIISGTGNESYLIASNSWNLNGSLTPNGTNIYRSTDVAGSQVFQLSQDYADRTSFRTVSYNFKNKFTQQAQPLNKLSLSIYDIDTSIAGSLQGTRYFRWFDQVTINGFTSDGSLVTPIVEFKGPGITSNAPYRQNTVTSAVACSGLDDNCKVSVAFTDPVVRVDVVYGNDPTLNYSSNNLTNNDPSSQIINIKFDSYCYKPQPRLTYKKELSDPRKANTDQFTVQIKDNADNSLVTNNITTTTTTGVGSTVTNGTGTTGTFKINPTKTYTLTEAASATSILSNYMPIYACKKSGLNGATITTLNPNSLQLTYGDDWTCTVTNGLKPYTFTGFVFNDNGGITARESTRQDTSSTFTNNVNYFNGIFNISGNNTESGIGANDLQVRLTNCGPNGGTDIAGTVAQSIPTSAPQGLLLGQYRFTVPASVVATLSPQKVCVVQVEPRDWEYSVDTTPNFREVSLTPNRFDYKTDSTLNLDFGEVQANNASLVLVKSQYVNNCDINANYDGTNGTPSQTPIFSRDSITNIEPGKCIAYRIEAYNRGHVDLKDIRISDELQTKAQGGLVNSVFALPVPKGDPASLYTGTTLPTGTITSEPFKLDKLTGTVPTKATLYFNTKYGTTVDP